MDLNLWLKYKSYRRKHRETILWHLIWQWFLGCNIKNQDNKDKNRYIVLYQVENLNEGLQETFVTPVLWEPQQGDHKFGNLRYIGHRETWLKRNFEWKNRKYGYMGEFRGRKLIKNNKIKSMPQRIEQSEKATYGQEKIFANYFSERRLIPSVKDI